MSLNPADIEDYIWNRFGYGSYASKLWFIGMEEGGGTLQEFEDGVKAWCARGKPEIDDVRAYHEACGVGKWFTTPPAFQTTWDGLIRVALAACVDEPKPLDVQKYQIEQFARSNGDEAVLELFPLPAKSLHEWIYADYSEYPKLGFLADKRRYRKHVGTARQAALRARLDEHQPLVVVYYGLSYRGRYEKIAGAPFEQTDIAWVFATKTAKTLHVLTLHPAAYRSSQQYFASVGRFIRPMLRT